MPASTPTAASLYRRPRYRADIISRAIWLYFRFSLRLRDIEELMAERGVRVSYETIRDGSIRCDWRSLPSLAATATLRRLGDSFWRKRSRTWREVVVAA